MLMLATDANVIWNHLPPAHPAAKSNAIPSNKIKWLDGLDLM